MKKIFFLLASLAVMFSCSKEEQGGGGDTPTQKATVVRLSMSSMTFEALSAEPQTVKVYADGSWTSQAPEWITLEPTTGSGTVTVTVKVTDNESIDGRTGQVVFAPDLTSSTTNKLTVQQKGDNKVTLKSGQDFAEWLAKLNEESLDEARLGADIDMSGVTFVPAKAFSGVLDGEGHSIKNLKATRSLFTVNKGTLKNIVIDATCSFEPDTTVFGTIVCRNEGKVSDCVNKANVTRKISNNASEMKSNLVGGVIGMSTQEDTLSGCKNYGNIALIVTDNGGFTSQGVAGVIGLTAGSVFKCENYGEVSLTGGWHVGRACPARTPDENGKIDSGEIFTTKVGASLGGVAGYVKGGLEDCLNKGKVTWQENTIEKIATSPARMFAGGVAGTYYGKCVNCTNEGEFNVKSVSTDGSAVKAYNHQLAMGGVFGACNNPVGDAPSKNKGMEIRNCVNKGAINLELNNYKGWCWFGGVIGYPNGENSQCNGTMYDCSNTGNFTVKGTSRFVLGGIAGTSPNMEGCTNKNTVTINGADEYPDASFGGLIGMHFAQKQVVKNCSSEATVTATVPLNVAGLVGCTDDASSHNLVSFSVEGCTVKGSLTTNGGVCGMLMGNCFISTAKISMGTSSAPIEVSGSVNGTTLTQTSPASLFWGAGFDSANHSMNYVVK